jgi:hypothetical protein
VLNSAPGVSGDTSGNLYFAESSPGGVTRLTPV